MSEDGDDEIREDDEILADEAMLCLLCKHLDVPTPWLGAPAEERVSFWIGYATYMLKRSHLAPALIANDPVMRAGESQRDGSNRGADLKRGKRNSDVTDDELREWLKAFHRDHPEKTWSYATKTAANELKSRFPPGSQCVSRSRNIQRRVPDTKW